MKKIFLAPLVAGIVFFVLGTTFAATYDATGTWLGNKCGPSNDCVPESPFEPPLITAIISQDGQNNVQVQIDGRVYRGTVTGAFYSVSVSWEEEDGETTETLTFTLISNTSTSGSGHWDWVYEPDQSWNCAGDYTFILYKQGIPATQNATGTWNYTESEHSNTCRTPDNSPIAGTAVVNQTGSTVTLTAESHVYDGSASGVAYTVETDYLKGSGRVRESMTLILDSRISGSGKVCWIYTETDYQCRGSHDISFEKPTIPGGSTFPPAIPGLLLDKN